MVAVVIPTTITGLQGRPIAATVPTVNQSLVWNGSMWAPAGPLAALPVSIANGGTGATSAAAGLAALGGTPRQRAATGTIIVSGTANFSSTSAVMGGYGNNGWVITPISTGTVVFGNLCWANGTTAGQGSYFGLAYGVGTPPAQGSPQAGNTIGVQASVTSQANQAFPFMNTGIVSGLTVGTQYWFDCTLQVLSGSMTVAQPAGFAVEI